MRLSSGPSFDDALRADFRALLTWYRLLFVVWFAGIVMAMLLFAERFRFWTYPFSDLGGIKTPGGLPNEKAMIAFSADMISCGVILASVAVATARRPALPHASVRVVFSVVASLGAFVAAFPDDVFSTQHMLGSGLLIGSLWVQALLLCEDVHARAGAPPAIRLHLILHTTILSYAFTYVIGVDIKHLFQKVALAGVFFVLLRTLERLSRQKDARRDYVPTEELNQ